MSFFSSTFSCSPSRPHIVLFPFMSKGHTIPIIHLSLLLLRRGATVSILTTPANRHFIAKFLAHTKASIIELPFPKHAKDIPAGVESTDNFTSMALFVPFVTALKLMQPQFEQALQTLTPISFIISDGFLPWTLVSASKFGIPRLSFYGMGHYAMTLTRQVGQNGLLFGPESDDEILTIAPFSWIKLTRNDFEPMFYTRERNEQLDFTAEAIAATSRSAGLVVNSFYDLESVFVDHWNRENDPKTWCVGPLCLVQQPWLDQNVSNQKATWMQWLDEKLAKGSTVLYVAFGSQADLSSEQLQELAIGLEKSEVHFLWVLKSNYPGLADGFEERVKERGMVVRGWVDQMGILNHKSTQGFVSHCGWNSVLESVCAGVPILVWPVMAEQYLNARFVVEEIKVGLRVATANGSVRGFVVAESVEKGVRELMEGEMGNTVRKKVKEVAEVAKKAMEEGGSSWCTLDKVIEETCMLRETLRGTLESK